MKYRLVLLVVLAGVWIWRSRRVAERPPAPRPSPARRPPAQPSAMVACRHCGLHLPASDALAGSEPERRVARLRLRRSLDNLFPDTGAATSFAGMASGFGARASASQPIRASGLAIINRVSGVIRISDLQLGQIFPLARLRMSCNLSAVKL